MSELNLARKDFQKMSISCFLIVAKDKFRSIGGSEFQRLRKLILRKLACTINANAVRGSFYENLSYKSFFTLKFPDLRYSYILSAYPIINAGATVMYMI